MAALLAVKSALVGSVGLQVDIKALLRSSKAGFIGRLPGKKSADLSYTPTRGLGVLVGAILGQAP